MGYMSPFHWIVVLLIIILLFGAKRIPDIAKGLGLGIKEFKKAAKDAEKEITSASSTESTPAKAEKKDDARA